MKGKIFNAQEVQAIIAGNKIMFRVVVKPQPKQVSYYGNLKNGGKGYLAADEEKSYPIISPFGKVGDEIFVKESFSIDGISLQGVWYWADGNPEFGDWTKPKPAQHMKQEHSRFTLRIKDIGVERIGDISEEDCFMEGVHQVVLLGYPQRTKMFKAGEFVASSNSPKKAFGKLWNKKHPKHSFESNCFVWKIKFEVVND